MPSVRRTKLALLAGMVAVAAGCSSDNGGPAAPATPVSGIFLDAAVSGMSFSGGGSNGLTDASGTFAYNRGSMVQFSIGDIIVGQGRGTARMTPVNLSPLAVDETDSIATNISRFLLTIDDDDDESNGIQVTDTVRTTALGRSVKFLQNELAFENDSGVQSVVSALTDVTNAGNRSLVSIAVAQAHLRDTLFGRVLSGRYAGSYANDQGVHQGTWEFGVDAAGVLSGTVTPAGGSVETLTGSTESDGTFGADVSNGMQFFGGLRLIDSNGDEKVSGRWFNVSEDGGISGSRVGD